MDTDNVETEFAVGDFVLGYDKQSGEWKNCEVLDILPEGYKVHFEDDADDQVVILADDEVQPSMLGRYQVGDQVLGFSDEDRSWYPCEILEVTDTGYIVHFFDTPADQAVHLLEDQVMEETVLAPDTPIFAYLEDQDKWTKGEIVSAVDTGYEVHLDGTPDQAIVELSDENIYPIEFGPEDVVMAWQEDPNNSESGAWLPAKLKEITSVGYKVSYIASPEKVVDLTPDRVRPDSEEVMEFDSEEAQ